MSYTPLDERRTNGKNVVIHHEDMDDADPTSSSSLPTFSSSSKRQDSSLSEPLNSAENGATDDPFYVFREDLYRKLELVDESLAEYLRVVHQTVSKTVVWGVGSYD